MLRVLRTGLVQKGAVSAAYPAFAQTIQLWNRTLATEASQATETSDLVVTERCAERLNKINMTEKDACLRVEVDGGGCQGFQYVFKLETLGNINRKEDKVFEKNGATVVIDEESLVLLKGAQIDYKSDLIGSCFVVGSNPQAEASCGCKRSFTVK